MTPTRMILSALLVHTIFLPAALRADEDLATALRTAGPEGIVNVPAGVSSEPVTIDRPLTLRGRPAGESVLEVTADQPALTVTSRQPVVIEGLTIKWQRATSDARAQAAWALLAKDADLTLRNCRFIAAGNVKRCPMAVQAAGFSNIRIENCRFEGFEFTIGIGEGAEGSLTDCDVLNPGHCGITVSSGAKVNVARCIVTGSKYHGLRNTGGTMNVRDSLIVNNANRGVYLGNRSASGRIHNNVIRGNGTGISAFAQSDATIENNVIADCDYAGLDSRDSCPITVRNNILTGNTRGLVLFEETGRVSPKIGRNTFWQNRTATENLDLPEDSLQADPQFAAPTDGDFTATAAAVKTGEQGLTDPETLRTVWKRWEELNTDRP